ncbi:Arc family DNA-binding protein [Pseudomonas sp. PDM18]|uniref:Arc family DNA-binding protein n=1 Tax=Pseudomonas sp. PDM18 TaxID=2769253 RepID=UPI0017837E68|nr:Arc family DNA-binding protein [Pseudomonas sp. PDM18]MBD9675527.1 Arc family DNA-binding protein [Pseudomonas sp. PDM18]
MKHTEAQFKMRMPQEMKAWLETKAKSRFHSMQAEVLGLIAEAKQRDEQIKQA